MSPLYSYLTSPERAVLYGVGIWLVVFVVSVVNFALRTGNRSLFESIMPVTLLVVTFSVLYLGSVNSDAFRESMVVGFLWLLISLTIDLVLFLPQSPMQMSLADYVSDIGVTYLLIPIIPIGLGYYTEAIRA